MIYMHLLMNYTVCSSSKWLQKNKKQVIARKWRGAHLSRHPLNQTLKLNKDINIKNKILVSLYWKRELGQASASDRKEILTRQVTLKRLRKELKEVIQRATRQKKLRDEKKRKLESMDKSTRKKLISKATSDLGRAEKCDKSELIKAICRTAISGSVAHDRRLNDVIRTVKTLDQLKEALNRDGFERKCSSVCLYLSPQNHRTIEGEKHVITAPVKL